MINLVSNISFYPSGFYLVWTLFRLYGLLRLRIFGQHANRNHWPYSSLRFLKATIFVIIYGLSDLLVDPGLLTHDGALLMGPEAAVLLAFLTGCISLLFGIFNFGYKQETNFTTKKILT